MKYGTLLSILVITAAVSACKIEVSVPEGGRVVSESGAYTCNEGKTCKINVSDLFFDETFVAAPKNGYDFSHWADDKEGGSLCGKGTDACRLYTSALESNPDLMAVLESDRSFPLRPVFVEACQLSSNTATDRFINNGRTVNGSSLNVFDDADDPIAKLTVRNAGCEQGFTCPFPGNPTEVAVKACNAVNILDIFETSTAVVDGGVVAALHTFGGSKVTIEAGVVRDVETYSNSDILVNGGKVNAITAFGNGEIVIEGGDLRRINGSVDAFAGYIAAQEMGHVIWRGGITDRGTVGNNTEGNLILSFDSGQVTIEGKNFTWSNAGGGVVNEPLEYGKLPKVLGWLSGTLANGDTFKDVFWEQRSGSQIVLAKP